MKTSELLDMLADRLSRAKEATAATVAGGGRTPELHMPRAMNMIEQCRAAIAQARANAATEPPTMETNELIGLLASRLEEAQRVIERLADYAAEAGQPVRGNEARIVARWCRDAADKARDVVPEQRQTGSPGYPGPCPDGMDWGAWLAMNNVD